METCDTADWEVCATYLGNMPVSEMERRRDKGREARGGVGMQGGGEPETEDGEPCTPFLSEGAREHRKED